MLQPTYLASLVSAGEECPTRTVYLSIYSVYLGDLHI